MASNKGKAVTLPALQPKVNYRGYPRRYEETKPAVVQDFTHRSILQLGNVIQREAADQFHAEKLVAVQEAERAVWQQAELLKLETVEKAVKKVHVEHEKIIKKLTKAHEKAIKEEGVRVEGEMQKLALEQVASERADGERRLAAAVTAAQKAAHDQMVLAVAQARREEQETAQKQREELQKAADEKLQSAIASAADDKRQALEELTTRKDREREEAVTQAHQEEQKITVNKLKAQKDLYDQNIKILHTHIGEHKAEIRGLEEDIQELIREKRRVQQELLDTRDEFDKFINRVRPFNDTEASFLLPEVKTITIN